MSTKIMEQTVTDLQRRVSEIENSLIENPRSGWRKIVGPPGMTIILPKPYDWARSGVRRRTGKNGEPMFVVPDTNHFAELVHDTEFGSRIRWENWLD